MTAKTVSKTDSKFNVKLIAITAMCAALITVTTAFIKIPSPLGYSHAGDSMIYLAASILPGPFGIIASSIGGALADLISGYPHWAIPTAIIKAINAVPFVLCRMAMKKRGKDEKIISPIYHPSQAAAATESCPRSQLDPPPSWQNNGENLHKNCRQGLSLANIRKTANLYTCIGLVQVAEML